MTYDLRTAADDGKACSTCRRGIVRFDRYAEPWFECYSLMTDVDVIENPDETVCDGWREKE